MDKAPIPISFDGFGPITSPKPSFAQGVGRDGSFAPIWTTEPKLPNQFKSSGSNKILSPFDANISVISPSTATVTISPGTVSGILPANILSPISISLSSTTYISLACTASNNVVTGVTVVASSTPFVGQTPTSGIAASSFSIPAVVIINFQSYNLLAKNWVSAVPVVAFITYSGPTNTPTPSYIWSW